MPRTTPYKAPPISDEGLGPDRTAQIKGYEIRKADLAAARAGRILEEASKKISAGDYAGAAKRLEYKNPFDVLEFSHGSQELPRASWGRFELPSDLKIKVSVDGYLSEWLRCKVEEAVDGSIVLRSADDYRNYARCLELFAHGKIQELSDNARLQFPDMRPPAPGGFAPGFEPMPALSTATSAVEQDTSTMLAQIFSNEGVRDFCDPFAPSEWLSERMFELASVLFSPTAKYDSIRADILTGRYGAEIEANFKMMEGMFASDPELKEYKNNFLALISNLPENSRDVAYASVERWGWFAAELATPYGSGKLWADAWKLRDIRLWGFDPEGIGEAALIGLARTAATLLFALDVWSYPVTAPFRLQAGIPLGAGYGLGREVVKRGGLGLARRAGARAGRELDVIGANTRVGTDVVEYLKKIKLDILHVAPETLESVNKLLRSRGADIKTLDGKIYHDIQLVITKDKKLGFVYRSIEGEGAAAAARTAGKVDDAVVKAATDALAKASADTEKARAALGEAISNCAKAEGGSKSKEMYGELIGLFETQEKVLHIVTKPLKWIKSKIKNVDKVQIDNIREIANEKSRNPALTKERKEVWQSALKWCDAREHELGAIAAKGAAEKGITATGEHFGEVMALESGMLLLTNVPRKGVARFQAGMLARMAKLDPWAARQIEKMRLANRADAAALESLRDAGRMGRWFHIPSWGPLTKRQMEVGGVRAGAIVVQDIAYPPTDIEVRDPQSRINIVELLSYNTLIKKGGDGAKFAEFVHSKIQQPALAAFLLDYYLSADDFLHGEETVRKYAWALATSLVEKGEIKWPAAYFKDAKTLLSALDSEPAKPDTSKVKVYGIWFGLRDKTTNELIQKADSLSADTTKVPVINIIQEPVKSDSLEAAEGDTSQVLEPAPSAADTVTSKDTKQIIQGISSKYNFGKNLGVEFESNTLSMLAGKSEEEVNNTILQEAGKWNSKVQSIYSTLSDKYDTEDKQNAKIISENILPNLFPAILTIPEKDAKGAIEAEAEKWRPMLKKRKE